MSGRYFYDNAVAAVWMARQYGMKFVSWHSGKEYDLSVIEANVGSPVESIRNDQRYVVHADSLRILQRQKVDLTGKGIWEAISSKPFTGENRIILRDELPFFWPEVEA